MIDRQPRRTFGLSCFFCWFFFFFASDLTQLRDLTLLLSLEGHNTGAQETRTCPRNFSDSPCLCHFVVFAFVLCSICISSFFWPVTRFRDVTGQKKWSTNAAQRESESDEMAQTRRVWEVVQTPQSSINLTLVLYRKNTQAVKEKDQTKDTRQRNGGKEKRNTPLSMKQTQWTFYDIFHSNTTFGFMVSWQNDRKIYGARTKKYTSRQRK